MFLPGVVVRLGKLSGKAVGSDVCLQQYGSRGVFVRGVRVGVIDVSFRASGVRSCMVHSTLNS